MRGESFPWERRTASGSIARYYWPKEHCLEREPLSIEANVWDLINARPEIYALVLENDRGEPIEVLGVRLRELVKQGKLKLYPAAYRLVAESEEHA